MEEDSGLFATLWIETVNTHGKGAVLVQREKENWRSPLASIPPSSADQLGEHRATQVATDELGGG